MEAGQGYDRLPVIKTCTFGFQSYLLHFYQSNLFQGTVFRSAKHSLFWMSHVLLFFLFLVFFFDTRLQASHRKIIKIINKLIRPRKSKVESIKKVASFIQHSSQAELVETVTDGASASTVPKIDYSKTFSALDSWSAIITRPDWQRERNKKKKKKNWERKKKRDERAWLFRVHIFQAYF